jgi:hypothetical protein
MSSIASKLMIVLPKNLLGRERYGRVVGESWRARSNTVKKKPRPWAGA